ncbi:MAG: hypothetical protein M3015_13795, partial [Bacteroidota bacterium]|nr:hypothetical protein [Bacteroidota bacterium]
MLRLPKILYVALLFFSLSTFAQQHNYLFQHLTTKDGLAPGITKFIFQDSKGFYWIGYDNGFQKFDGKNFTTTSFRNKYILNGVLEGIPPLPLEDKNGNVYILNQGSVYIYHLSGKTDTIQVFD